MDFCIVCCTSHHSINIFECKKCLYKSCKKCCKKYFFTLADDDKESHCMNCKTAIDKFILISFFGIKWVFGTFMNYKKSNVYKTQHKILHGTNREASISKKNDTIIEKRKKLLLERRRINKELKSLKSDLVQLKYSNLNIRCSFVCEGFLDSSNKCMICCKITCIVCYSGAEEGHVCNNSINVYNISKPCPKCSEFITREDGCNKIKCINCDVYFDWKSGQIINNTTNNTNNNINLVAFNKIDLFSINSGDRIILEGMYNHINEFIRISSIKLIDELSNNNMKNKLKNIRINYLNDKISKTKFNRQIIKISKFYNYRIYIINIILSAYNKAINVFNNGKNYLEELNEIINDTNIIIIKITNYLKYTNNIKILHWFNLNDIDKLIK